MTEISPLYHIFAQRNNSKVVNSTRQSRDPKGGSPALYGRGTVLLWIFLADRLSLPRPAVGADC